MVYIFLLSYVIWYVDRFYCDVETILHIVWVLCDSDIHIHVQCMIY